jgi:hypothetical protein
LEHPRDVPVLYEHGIIRLDEPRRQLVLEVLDLPLDSTLDLGSCSSLFLPVVTTASLSGETPLFTAQPFVLVREVKPVHAVAITRVDVVVDAEVDPNTIFSIHVIYVGFLGECVVFDFEAERDVPFTRRLLLQCDLLDGGVIGE